MPEPYAATRLDALRKLRREGYAVVDREGYERWRRNTVDDPTSIYHEAERLRLLVVACRDWFDNPDGEPSSGDLLDRINKEPLLNDGPPAQRVPPDVSGARDRQPWEFFDGD